MIPVVGLLVAALVADTRWAVVTGASAGIGRSLAIETARRGYSVVLAARRRRALADVAAEIERAHPTVRTKTVAVDLSKRSGASRLHRATRHLPVRLLVANAGFSSVGPLTSMDLDGMARMAHVNMLSVAALCRLYGAEMPRGGAILITSSLTALAPLPGAAMYGASRAFVHSLAGALALELSPQAITVRCVLPGSTDTTFSRVAGIEASLAFNGPLFRPLQVIMQADDVAAAGA